MEEDEGCGPPALSCTVEERSETDTRELVLSSRRSGTHVDCGSLIIG